MNKYLFASITILLCFTGCAKTPEVVEIEPVVTALVIDNLGRGNTGSLRDTTLAAYRTLGAWEEISSQLSPLEPFPDYDTSQVMILLVAIPTNSGGFAVQIESVEATEEELIATYEFSIPGFDCLTVSALSLAFQAVKIPRSNLPIRFVQEDETFSCSTR